MRKAILFGAVCLAAALHVGSRGFERLEVWFAAPEVAAALDVRCGDFVSRERHACELVLHDQFAEGELDPVAVLRQHCTRRGSVWPGSHRADPPAMCVDRFGGWISG